MTAFDPLAALANDAALTPSSVAALDLGVQIEILQAQLSVGDLLTATVLPPQGGADRLSFLGQTVAAQLPPGVDPGESLLLQVSGFSGNQVYVRNLGVVDPQNPPPTVDVVLPPAAQNGAAQVATLTTVVSRPPPAPGSATLGALPQSAVQPAGSESPAVPPAGPIPGAVSPPRAVFVAASVQPAPVPSGATPAAVPPAPAPPASYAVLAPDAPPVAVPAPAPTPAAQLAADLTALGLEARIAATRAAALDLSDLVTASAPAGQPEAPSPAPQPGIPAPGLLSEAARAATAPPAPAAAPVAAPVAAAPPPPSAAAPPASAEVALLARLRVPALPLTLAAARLAGTAAEALPRALARLDAALRQITSGPNPDPAAVTVRNAAAFLQRLDPSNARALPEQLAAYVANVVEGAEGKLGALVRALLEARAAQEAVVEEPPVASPAPPESVAAAAQSPSPSNEPPASAPGAGQSPGVAPSAASPQAPPSADATQPPLAPSVAAHVAERTVALQYDLKGALLALASEPARAGAAAPAVTQALAALTALQLNALSAQRTDPSTIAIPLPVFFHEHGRPVQLRIDREAPGAGKMDADNFHIAFILDTRSLGTVAVDLQTVGRSVSVNVKTQGTTAAQRFRATSDELKSRLEQLRYRVAAIAAGVVAPRGESASAPPAPEPEKKKSGWDFRA